MGLPRNDAVHGGEYVWLLDEENWQYCCKWHIMEDAL